MRERVLRKTQTLGSDPSARTFAVGYQYAAGRTTGITYPSGRMLSYAFDGQGRASGVTIGGQTVLSGATYFPFGALHGWTWAGGQAYRRELERFVFRSGQLMAPVFEAVKQTPRRIVYGEGEDERRLLPYLRAKLGAGSGRLAAKLTGAGKRALRSAGKVSLSLSLTATDASGNESAESATRTITIDTTDPVVNISAPTDGRGRRRTRVPIR